MTATVVRLVRVSGYLLTGSAPRRLDIIEWPINGQDNSTSVVMES